MLPPPISAMDSESAVSWLHSAGSSVAEQRRADAHDGRALRDRGLEVGAHAHRQRVERQARRVAPSAPARRSCANAARCAAASACRRAACTSGRAAQARQWRDHAQQRQQLRPAARHPWLVRRRCAPGRRRSAAVRGRAAAPTSRSAMRRRSTPCTQSKCSATARVLLPCRRPMKCQSGGAACQRAGSWAGPRPHSSRRNRRGPAPCAARMRRQVLPFADGQKRDGAHIPASRLRGRCHAFADCARRPARSVLAVRITGAEFCGVINIGRRCCPELYCRGTSLGALMALDIAQLLAFAVKNQRLGPAPVGRRAADDPRRRRHEAHQHARTDPQGSAQHGVRHHERQAAQGLRGVLRDRFLVRDPEARALPRQRLQPEPRRRRRVPQHSLDHRCRSTTWARRRSSATCACCRAAWCWSPARPARASPPRWPA